MLKLICIALQLCSTISGHARIIDGDTVVINGFHIRIWGLDAEELTDPHGYQAKSAIQLIIANRPVDCELTGDKSYDRYVAVCVVNGNDLAAEMVKRGYALDCAHYSHGRYRHLEPAGARTRLKQAPYC